MQINVLPASHPAVMSMLSLPETTPVVRQWIQEQINQGTEYLTDYSRGFVQKAVNLWEQFNDGSLERAARSVTRAFTSLLHPNAIVELYTLESIRAAKPVMQRYLMAHEGIRSLYHQQLCDGYSDSYIDLHQGKIGDQHEDWRRVMDGQVSTTTNKEGLEQDTITFYIDTIPEGDRELSRDEKCMVFSAWDAIDSAIANNEDPSDIFNGQLGISG